MATRDEDNCAIRQNFPRHQRITALSSVLTRLSMHELLSSFSGLRPSIQKRLSAPTHQERHANQDEKRTSQVEISRTREQGRSVFHALGPSVSVTVACVIPFPQAGREVAFSVSPTLSILPLPLVPSRSLHTISSLSPSSQSLSPVPDWSTLLFAPPIWR